MTIDMEDVFTYHPPKADQPARYQAIREEAKAFAKVICANAPDSADRDIAIQKLREAVMFANASIALE